MTTQKLRPSSETLQAVRAKWGQAVGPQAPPTASIRPPGGPVLPLGVIARVRPGARILKASPGADAGQTDPDFTLLARLGEGRLGVVYSACQTSLDREIAVKLIHPAEARRAEAEDEFLAEAALTGRLDHPNIVPVYDVCRTADGALFYAMKEVRGKPWSTLLREKPLADNLRVLLSVCDAVAYAHDKGLVHRDLKPENVMLGEYGEVALLGWSVAIRVGGAPTAAEPPPAGTPAYMAPEMASAEAGHTGTASDVYLLGGILYEIATGLRPHGGENVYECLSAAMQNVIQPTGKTGELIDIARTAMATRPEDRHPSVKAFQEAIRDYLGHAESFSLSAAAGERLARLDEVPDDDVYREVHEIVAGCQQSLKLWPGNRSAALGLYQARNTLARIAADRGNLALAASEASALQIECRVNGLDTAHEKAAEALAGRVETAMAAARTRGLLVRISSALLALAGLVALAGLARAYYLTRLERDEAIQARVHAVMERDRAQAAEQREMSLRQQAQEALSKAGAEYSALDLENYCNLIGLAQRRINEGELAQAESLLWNTPRNLRDWEWGWLLLLCHRDLQMLAGHSGSLLSCAFSPGGTRLLTAGTDKSLIVWDGGKPVLTVATEEPVLGAAFSRDGQDLLALTRDGRILRWSAADGRGPRVQPLQNGVQNLQSLRLSPDAGIAMGGTVDGKIRQWDADTGTELAAPALTAGASVDAVAVAADRRTLAALTSDGRLQVWEAAGESLRPGLRLGSGGSAITCMALSADGRKLLTAGGDATARVWDTKSGKLLLYLRGHGDTVSCAAFSADGRRLLTGSLDRSARMWDALASEDLVSIKAHASAVPSLAFSRDGSSFVTAGEDGFVRLWRTSTGEAIGGPGSGCAGVASAVSPDGSQVFTVSRDRKVGAWDPAAGKAVATWGELREPVCSLALSPDGACLAAAGRESVVLWDTAGGRRKTTVPAEGRVDQVVAFSPDSRLLAVAGQGAALCSVESGQKRTTLNVAQQGTVNAVAFSPDGKCVAVGGRWGAILCSAANGDSLLSLADAGPVSCVAFLSGGKRLVTAGRGVIKVWDTAGGRELVTLRPAAGWVTALAGTADGRFLAAASDDGSVRVWGGFDPAMDKTDLPEQHRLLLGL